MVIYYTDKIENKELGYCLCIDLVEDKEYWLDLNTDSLYISENAGGDLVSQMDKPHTLTLRGGEHSGC